MEKSGFSRKSPFLAKAPDDLLYIPLAKPTAMNRYALKHTIIIFPKPVG
jgi:hypothetical protein